MTTAGCRAILCARKFVSGRGAIPHRRYSPRPPLWGADSVRLRGRRYSPDARNGRQIACLRALLQCFCSRALLVCLPGSHRCEKGFPQFILSGASRPGRKNHEKRHDPQPDRCRHAQRGSIHPHVHRVSHPDADSGIYQDGLLGPARPAGRVCPGPGVWCDHQLYEEPAPHRHQGHLHSLCG